MEAVIDGGIYIVLNRIICTILLLFQFLCGCFVLGIKAWDTTSKIKDIAMAISTVMAILFQPALLVFISLVLLQLVEVVIPNFVELCVYSFYHGNILFNTSILFIAIFPIQFFVFLFISITELAFYLLHKEALFNKSFAIQYHGVEYILAIISLIAIYTSLDPYNANSTNTLLIIYGSLFTVCMIMADLYKAFYLSNNVVKNLYVKITGQNDKEINDVSMI